MNKKSTKEERYQFVLGLAIGMLYGSAVTWGLVALMVWLKGVL